MVANAMRKLGGWSVAAGSLLAVAATPATAARVHHGAARLVAAHHDASLPLRRIAPASQPRAHRALPLRRLPRHAPSASPTGSLQRSAFTLAAPSPLLNFDGIGNGFSGPQGTYSVGSAPPDPNAAVGPNHIVETVNTHLAVFNKSGSVLYGPVPLNTLWSGFGGGCQTNNDGDPSVSYDRAADRWVIQQFSVSTTPYLECVAVSQTPDPLGAYNRYSFQYTDFPDYPKLAVWPDAYYVTYNMFTGGTTYNGGRICALDRARMLAGAAATQQCFVTTTSFGGLLASDSQGASPPPAGSPDYVVSLASSASQLAYWKFHVDWATPANTTFTGPATLATSAFSEACSGGTCIPQAGTTQKLDSLGDRLMYRLAYRNFGDHQSLVVNHSVTAGSSVGVRWYELRPDSSQNLSIFQQGTYAPDSNYRWMGSIAQDQAGDMALGFSLSGTGIHPQIHYTGRLAGDAAGLMTQGEGTIINGAGSQTGSSLSRWGDYSSMSVDPTDDCTFFYTQEYIPSNGAFNWSTRIASFKFPECGTPPANDFAIGASPASMTLARGTSGSSTISTAVTSGSAETVNLSVFGAPAGASVSLSPTSVTAGGSSLLTVNAGTAASGTYNLTVTGSAASASHSTTVGLTVTAPGSAPLANGGFETGNLSAWKPSGSPPAVVAAGCHSGSYCAQLGSTSPSKVSNLAQKFVVPSGASTLSFWYRVSCPDTVNHDWATAKLKDNTAQTTTTLLAKTCSNSGPWTQVSGSVIAGHNYTLTLTSRDDNKAGDPTYTLYDDVAVA
jgi:hypothetical protein